MIFAYLYIVFLFRQHDSDADFSSQAGGVPRSERETIESRRERGYECAFFLLFSADQAMSLSAS